MRKPNPTSFTLPALLITMVLLAASCARSPYNFVKVQPKKPFDQATPAAALNPGTPAAINKTTLPGAPQAAFKSPVLKNSRPPAARPASAAEKKAPVFSSRREQRRYERQQARERKEQTRKVVSRELKKSSAFGALSAKKLEKVEKIISKQANKIAKKKAASPAPIGFNQWMKIGVILLLVGLVVGIAFADLGYLVAVIGVVFLVLGLIQQL